MVKKYAEQYSVVIREVQMKPTLRLYLLPIRMAKIQKTTTTNVSQDMGKGNSLLVELQTAPATMKIGVENFQKS